MPRGGWALGKVVHHELWFFRRRCRDVHLVPLFEQALVGGPSKPRKGQRDEGRLELWVVTVSSAVSAGRLGLQQAATVPLMLAFYCIIGGTGPLPEFRHDLYTKVLNRMLTGRWRDDDDRQPDARTCLQTLRAWAWDGAMSHPVSGVGTWADDIPAKRIRLGAADACQGTSGLPCGRTADLLAGGQVMSVLAVS